MCQEDPILLCALFLLWAFDAFLKGGKKNGFVSLILFLTALLCKESAIVFPFLLVSYLLFTQKQKEVASRTWPYFVSLLVYFFIRRVLGIVAVFRWDSFSEATLGVLTFLKACFIFEKHLIFPIGLYYDSSLELFTSFTNPEVLVVAAVWILAVAVLIIYRKKIAPVIWFFIFWILINLVTVSQLVPVKIDADRISTADHFLYLSSIGYLFILILIIRSLIHKKIIRYVLVLGFGTFLLLTTIQQSILASNQIAMFEHSLKQYPKNMRVLTALAIAYAFDKEPEKAEGVYRQMLVIEPYNIKAQIGLGKVLCEQDKCWEALVELEKIKNPGPFAKVYQEKVSVALERLEKSFLDRIEMEPKNEEVYYSLGVVYSKMNRLEDAKKQFRKAIELKPDYKNALYNLGVSYGLQGDTQTADEYINKANQL